MAYLLFYQSLFQGHFTYCMEPMAQACRTHMRCDCNKAKRNESQASQRLQCDIGPHKLYLAFLYEDPLAICFTYHVICLPVTR
jgi:hypothetical protein